MNPRHVAALVFMVLVFFAGCFVAYEPDPSIHVAGWKCPDPDKMSHLVTYKVPACGWLPGAIFFKTCFDKTVVAVEEARGCVPEASPTPTATATP